MPTSQSTSACLASFAIDLALAARQETLTLSSKVGHVENKAADGMFDPVTTADRAAEAAMRRLILERYPEHGIEGEEFAPVDARGRFTWSLDPIDGTRSYICGLPTWTTLIALLDEGEPVVGLIDAPILDELYLGTALDVALMGKDQCTPISTSGCKCLSEARFSTTDPFLFGSSASIVERLQREVRVTRFGLDGYGYARLAAGHLDLVIECGLKPHDYNALIPVIRAAGGKIGNWKGDSDVTGGNVIAAASAELYDEAVALVASA